jgi:flagellar basal body-associated protein FliL
MLFSKKDKKEEKIDERPAKKRLETYDIKVMPVKFQKVLKPSGGGVLKLAIILIVALVVISGIVFGVLFLLNSMETPEVPAPRSANNNQNINQPEDINQNVNQPNENVNTNDNVNQNTNFNENVNTNINENVNTNVNANINAPTTQPIEGVSYFMSQDSDADGLTDVEEDLYETEKRKPDTDGDGFIDGQEIIGGYNPKSAGTSLLSNSGFVNKYPNPTYNYEILHLSTWVARPSDQSLSEVNFQSATGEYVQILVEDNPQELDLISWYLAETNNANISDIDRKTDKQGFEILVSKDKLTYFLLDNDNKENIFIISYEIGSRTSLNFLTSFEMMINSFTVIEAPTVESGN